MPLCKRRGTSTSFSSIKPLNMERKKSTTLLSLDKNTNGILSYCCNQLEQTLQSVQPLRDVYVLEEADRKEPHLGTPKRECKVCLCLY
nr:hypothetical protein Cplu_299 [Cedratvirus plubellavi]